MVARENIAAPILYRTGTDARCMRSSTLSTMHTDSESIFYDARRKIMSIGTVYVGRWLGLNNGDGSKVCRIMIYVCGGGNGGGVSMAVATLHGCNRSTTQ